MTTQLRSVLQVNVRLSEGGAAGVARSISQGLVARGIRAPIAYGYSTGGRASPDEGNHESVRVTPAAVAAANRVAFPYVGEETAMRGPRSWGQFRRAVASADVVHLHAVHSHMARVSDLVDVCLQSATPVVWTMHDHWLLTGRCAQPGPCREYLKGCPSCPNLAAYPPARIDHAAKHWPRRRDLIRSLEQTGQFALVSCANWLAEATRSAGVGRVETVTNSVDPTFWEAVSGGMSQPEGRMLRVLFMCRDLRDPVKVDWRLLGAVAQLPNVVLTIVGDNSGDQRLESATHIAATSDRERLAAIMSTNDVLLFSSTVDYYPLTFAEALVAGMHVVAIQSDAASEFRDFDEVSIAESQDEIVSLLAGVGDVNLMRSGRRTRVERHRQRFRPDAMIERYVDIYQRVLEGMS